MSGVPKNTDVPAGVAVPLQRSAPRHSPGLNVAAGLLATRDAAVREMDAERARCADYRCPCRLDPRRLAALPLFVDARGRVWLLPTAPATGTPQSSWHGVPRPDTSTAIPACPLIPVHDVRVLHVPLTPVSAHQVCVGNEIVHPITGTLAYVLDAPDRTDPRDPVAISTDAGEHRCQPGSGVLVADPQLLGLADRVRRALTHAGRHLSTPPSVSP